MNSAPIRGVENQQFFNANIQRSLEMLWNKHNKLENKVNGIGTGDDFNVLDGYLVKSTSGIEDESSLYETGGKIQLGGTTPAASFDIVGDLKIGTVAAKSTAGTTFLTTESGIVKSRTAAQVLGDIGATTCGICFTVFQATSSVGVSVGVSAFTVPAIINAWDLYDVTASVYEKGVTGTTNVMVRRRRNGLDVDMLSTPVTIGDEYFADDETINTSNDDVSTGDQIYIDVDTVHSGTAPKGLSVALTFRKA